MADHHHQHQLAEDHQEEVPQHERPIMILDQEKPHLPKRRRPLPPPSPRYHGPPKDPLKVLCTIITIFLLLAGLAVLIVWLIYRPHKPRFTVVGAAIYDLNITTPPFLSSAMQFTLVTRNPNKRVSIIYDRLTAHVSYRNQEITPRVELPPLYQESKMSVSFSPVMGGAGVPVSMEVANGLVIDEGYGVVALRVVLLGRLRWKAGAIRTGRYGVYVRCDVWVGFKKGLVGQVPLLGSPPCKVDI